jgi:uncharacterized protein YkwD
VSQRILAGLLLLSAGCAGPGISTAERRVFELVNAERKSRGLSTLAWDERLANQARTHSRRMAELGFFGHTDFSRGGLRQRMRAARVAKTTLAENLHRSKGYGDRAAVAVREWLKSEGHRRNLLDSGFALTGVCEARAPDGVWYATQIFASR